MADDLILSALNRAASELPEGWQITIEVELNAGYVSLHDPEGEEHEFPCNRESMAQDVLDALEYAVEASATLGGKGVAA